MRKKLLAFFCAACLLATLTTGVAAQPQYTDVPSDAWYRQSVEKMTRQGILSGTNQTTFAPFSVVTRAAVIAVLWRMEGSPSVAADSFSDVSPESWYRGAADWAREVGIASGYANGSFRPEEQILRQELAVLLYRYDRYKGKPIATGVLDLYSDAPYISDWAVEGMQHAVGIGLMGGDTQGRLSPLGVAYRADLAVILDRMTTQAVG